MIFGLGAVALLGAGGYLYATDSPMLSSVGLGGTPKPTGPFVPKKEDYQKVYDAVAEALIENDDYDDGSYAPVVLRLGWHASGTYDKETGTGGSNGATMRFAPEKDHGANAGLHAARDFLEPIKEKFPWISYSDLWTLAAVCAVQEMGGPTIPWRPGRADHDVSFCTPDGRLPDGAKDQKHLRAIFGRMGFNDQEIVALAGAHAVGRCHTDRSGFEGPWTFSPITFTNEYYRLLVEEKWHWRKWNGPAQFQDNTTNSLMMLPTDMSLIKDKNFKPWVEKYAKDQDLFFAHFGDAAMRLFELGVPFTSGEDARIEFKRTE
ncbi:heme peroxidase [Lineolata rhizophorae]|uniref:Peroxidase n=1 Tax=Lineolata rhizophorae TaxID=578093 RepID=A0A6A6PCL4_9PEZI|nr:heme peroxidase [Lineolata rhizophorae]